MWPCSSTQPLAFFHWFDLVAPLVFLLLLIAVGAVLWGVVYFFVNLFQSCTTTEKNGRLVPAGASHLSSLRDVA